MKKTIAYIFVIIGYLGMVIGMIWAFIAFILYLVKDIPFNWWSVWCILISFVVMFSSYLYAELGKHNTKLPPPKTYKSKLQERIEEMQAKATFNKRDNGNSI